ncbi:uncharacterized protein LOC113359864 [Papaver somniferum]|uniref:uncharacterized protein LOC113359864 n=1 Tax=Papaver somniferum TaxID=3469 RepID=UPI000E6F9121|nr:uncharacterized protein LOC113359864 [Papaver somniferum]
MWVKKLDTLITTINNNYVHDEEVRTRKNAEDKQLREEDRATRKLDLKEHTTELSRTLSTELTTALSTSLGTTLRDVFREFNPNFIQRQGIGPPPPPPPTGGNETTIRAGTISLKFPTFDGDDPDGWIFSTDQYFNLHVVADNMKLVIASAHLKGDANAWYRWKRTTMTVNTCLEFCSLVRARFSETKFVDARMAVSMIKQKGTVREHIPEFERLLNFFTDLPEKHLFNCFIHSLKPEIGIMVKLLEPQTLTAAFTKAINQEDVLSAAKQPYRPPQLRSSSTPSPPQFKKNPLPPGAKRLTWQEQKEKKEKGLCFNCDQFFTPGHLCLKPRLLILEGAPEGVETEAHIISEDSTIHPDNEVDDGVAANISLHSLVGSSFPRTMRINGFSKEQPLTLLIDSGATHNFLHPALVKKCGYSSQATDNALCVTVGDGGKLNTLGTCFNVPIRMQYYSFTTDFHVLPISGCDAVLGVQWLRTLGQITWDFDMLIMNFEVNGAAIQLLGNNSSYVMLLDSVPMQRLLHREFYGVFLQLSAKATSLNATPAPPPEIQHLLSQFADVFQPPTSLPPVRLHDHRIQLLPGSTPVNARPYRYPHFQKDEIDKIIAELSQAGFIRSSSSPFSSPI